MLATIRKRLRSAQGIAMVPVMIGALVMTTVSVGALAAAGSDLPLLSRNAETQQATAAAQAGVDWYIEQLMSDPEAWKRCTNLPTADGLPAPVNQKGSHARKKIINLANGRAATFAIELLPVGTNRRCVPGNSATFLDPDSNSLNIRVTGVAGTGSNRAVRALLATLRRQSLSDYVYFSDKEVAEPSQWANDNNQYLRPETPLIDWYMGALNKRLNRGVDDDRGCNRYRREGWLRSDGTVARYSGRELDTATGDMIPSLSKTWSPSCYTPDLGTGDTLAGPVHTNDTFGVCGDPTFGREGKKDVIEFWDFQRVNNKGPQCGAANQPRFASDAIIRKGAGTQPVPNARVAPGASSAYPQLPLPDTANSTFAAARESGWVFEGPQEITLNANQVTVRNMVTGATRTGRPANRVIAVTDAPGKVCRPYDAGAPDRYDPGCGIARVRGNYDDLRLTIAAQQDVQITGDITRTGDGMLGLIGVNYVRVWHPIAKTACKWNDDNAAGGAGDDVRIDAAIAALRRSFLTDNWRCGASLGAIKLTGSVAQRYNGLTGTSGSWPRPTGYGKNYQFDERLTYRSPPFFLGPVSELWRAVRVREQSEAKEL